MSITIDKIQSFLNDIETAKLLISELPDSDTLDYLAKLENQMTLHHLEICLKTTAPDDLPQALIQLLSNRWERIRDSFISYTSQPINPVNHLCLDLATALSPIPDNEDELDDLSAGQGPYFLLMPSLKAHEDIFTQNIHSLRLHEFILSDDAARFIPLAKCLNAAFESSDGLYRHIANINDTYPALTISERSRLAGHSTLVRNYLQAIDNYNHVRFSGYNFGSQLTKLIKALKEGGSKREALRRAAGSQIKEDGATEMNAGHQANEGIFAFFQYWNTLEADQINELYNKHPTLKKSLDRLSRPTESDYKQVIFCVELVADSLDEVLERHNLEQDNITTPKQAAQAFGQQLEEALVQNDYPVLTNKIQAPKMARHLFRSNEVHMVSRDQDWLLTYALQHEPEALPYYVDTLTEPMRKQITEMRIANSIDATALIMAAKCPQGAQAIEILLSMGAKLEAGDKNNSRALHWAASMGHLANVEVLLAHKASLTAKGWGQNTALSFAVRDGRDEVVTRLLETGMSLLDRNANGHNVLDLALAGHVRLVEPLLVQAMKLKPLLQQEFLSKIDGGIYKNILMYVLEKRPEFAQTILSVLHQNHSPQAVLYLLNSRNTTDKTPLMITAAVGNNELVRGLLASGAYIDAANHNNSTALHWASQNGHLEVVKTLLAQEASIDALGAGGQTPLLFALQSGQGSVAACLLENGASLLPRNYKGINSLEYALTKLPTFVDRLLLQAINLDHEEQKEWLKQIEGGKYNNVLLYALHKNPDLIPALLDTMKEQGTLENNQSIIAECGQVLLFAIQSGNIDLARNLLNIGADIEARDPAHMTALHLASSSGRIDLVNLLLDAGADIDAIDTRGNNALFIAIIYGYAGIVNKMLEHGASIDYRNTEDNNSLDIALIYNPNFIETLLTKVLTLSEDRQRAFFIRTGEVICNANRNAIALDVLFTALSQSKFSALVGPFLNSTNATGEPLLIQAAKANDHTIIEKLLNLGAGINAVDSHHNTALHWAGARGHSNLLAVLLNHGGSIEARNAAGANVLDIALTTNNSIFVDLLLRYARAGLNSDAQREFLSSVGEGIDDRIAMYQLRRHQPRSLEDLITMLGEDQRANLSAAQAELTTFFDFDSRIQPLLEKLEEMSIKATSNPNYLEAVTAANTLINKLYVAKATFLLSEAGPEEKKSTFRTDCLNAIQETKPVLQTHREWGKLIGGFILGLLIFPISLPMLARGTFFSFKTKGQRDLETLEQEVSAIAVPGAA